MDCGGSLPELSNELLVFNQAEWNENVMSADEQSGAPRLDRFGAFEADLAGGELRREGTLVKLQGQPFRLLALLLERPGAIISREEVRTALWPDGCFVDFEDEVNMQFDGSDPSFRKRSEEIPSHVFFVG
jgi:DNA-binding response OmpR family regulator